MLGRCLLLLVHHLHFHLVVHVVLARPWLGAHGEGLLLGHRDLRGRVVDLHLLRLRHLHAPRAVRHLHVLALGDLQVASRAGPVLVGASGTLVKVRLHLVLQLLQGGRPRLTHLAWVVREGLGAAIRQRRVLARHGLHGHMGGPAVVVHGGHLLVVRVHVGLGRTRHGVVLARVGGVTMGRVAPRVVYVLLPVPGELAL